MGFEFVAVKYEFERKFQIALITRKKILEYVMALKV